ncbi:MAG: fdrA domain protein [Clostridia bacterium]|nr:fdrA domain protein [Clostridia bacterium]
MEKKNLINRLFTSQLWVVNIGVDVFYSAVLDQKVPAVQVDWRPPAGGDVRLAEILAKLKTI